MARSVRIPTHVVDAKISHSAVVLWIELSRLSTPKKPLLTLNLASLAQKLRRSKRTVARLVTELEKAGLLTRVDYINRYDRVAFLSWSPKEPKPEEPSEEELVPLELHAEAERIFARSKDKLDFTIKMNQLLKEHRKKRKEDSTEILC